MTVHRIVRRTPSGPAQADCACGWSILGDVAGITNRQVSARAKAHAGLCRKRGEVIVTLGRVVTYQRAGGRSR